MDLYLCSTPYQLMNAMLIAADRNLSADLLIINMRLKNICDLKAIEASNVFCNVYIWDEITNRIETFSNSTIHYIKNTINKVGVYFRPKKLCRSIPNADKVYKMIFIGYADYPSQCVYYHFKKKGAVLSLYDEGTYSYKCLTIKPNIIRKAVSKIIFKEWIMNSVTSMYARSPSKIDVGEYKNIKIVLINHPEQIMKKQFYKIFYGKAEDINALNDRMCIFFDQNIDRQEIRAGVSDIADRVANIVGDNNIIIKLHPFSSEKARYSSRLTILKTKVPFEILINSGTIGRKVLISLFSTTCFTPKYLYDDEPYVIFLYKVLKFDQYVEFNKKYLNSVNDLILSYRDKKRIIIPESTAELERCIKEIYEKER